MARGWKSAVAKFLLIAALGAGALYYYKPEYFNKVKPLIESIERGVKSLVSNKAEEQLKSSMEGVYACKLKENYNTLFPQLHVYPGATEEYNGSHRVCKDETGDLVYGARRASMVRNGSKAYGEWKERAGLKLHKSWDDAFVYNDVNGDYETGGKVSLKDEKLYIEQTTTAPAFPQAGKLRFVLECIYQEPCEGDDKLIRAVFIRPCEGDLYASFGANDNPAVTRVGGGTLESVCKDLKTSGVTDVFLPFKVDDEIYSHCGKNGELLYDSAYDDHENAKFKNARQNGFDPIMALMNACAPYGIKFHAWFPVFKDPFAVLYAKAQGMEGGVEAGGPPNTVGIYPVLINSETYANPAIGAVLEYEMSLLVEIIKNYPGLVGINLDYIRYPGTDDFAKAYNEAQYAKKSDKRMPAGYQVLVNSDAITQFVKISREQFSGLTLSADVKAGEGARNSVGQDGILPYLNIIMPMVYTESDFESSSDVQIYVSRIHDKYKNVVLVPALRGWVINKNIKGLLLNLPASISAAKKGGATGYAIFTYEALLDQTDTNKLTDIKKRINY